MTIEGEIQVEEKVLAKPTYYCPCGAEVRGPFYKGKNVKCNDNHYLKVHGTKLTKDGEAIDVEAINGTSDKLLVIGQRYTLEPQTA